MNNHINEDFTFICGMAFLSMLALGLALFSYDLELLRIIIAPPLIWWMIFKFIVNDVLRELSHDDTVAKYIQMESALRASLLCLGAAFIMLIME